MRIKHNLFERPLPGQFVPERLNMVRQVWRHDELVDFSKEDGTMAMDKMFPQADSEANRV